MSVLLGFAERRRIDTPTLASPTRRRAPQTMSPLLRKAAQLETLDADLGQFIEQLIDEMLTELARTPTCSGEAV